jgi:hypothetical protein
MLPQRNSELAWKKIGPYFVIIDPISSKQIYSLNEIGQIIWECCDGEHSIDACVDKLFTLYDCPKDQLKQDVEQFILQLSQLGVLFECS